MVCGFAAGAPHRFSLFDFVQFAGAEVLSDQASVSEFVSSSLDALFSQNMEFVPLIPEDGSLLSMRLGGLGEWCAGFLSGFGASVAGRLTRDALHVDVQEILRDFASISRLDDQVDEDEQDEVSFMELYEYVRVAAVLTSTLMAEAVTGGEKEGEQAEEGTDH